jgi:hypothetical protein
LKDVAKGTIIQPKGRSFHTNKMPADVLRVKYDIVLPGCDNVRPPSEPQGWEEEEPATLATGFHYMYLWPKSQIRLGTEECRRTTPQQPTQPEQRQQSQPAAEPAQPPAPEFFDGDQMAQDPALDDNLDDDINFNIEDWVNTGANIDPDASYGGPSAPEPSARPKAGCQVRLFGSQETPPPVAFTEPQRAAAPMLSPGALHRAAGEVFEAPLMAPDKSKKGRKRKPKSASQVPPPTIAQDGPVDNSGMPVHEAGTGMMNPQLLAVATPHMRHLHHACLYIEQHRIKDKDESYNVFKVKVPEVLGFIFDVPADIFYVRHSDIFDLLRGIQLHDTLVRLYTLNLASNIIRDGTPGLAIVDPYYMRDVILRTPTGYRAAVDYLKGFLLAHSDKANILVPYHPESNSGRQHCVLICLDVRESRTWYLDSGSNHAPPKNYDTIKKVLDAALTGYIKEGVTVRREVKKFGMHKFSHKTEFWCVKQAEDTTKDAFYVLYHMKGMVLDAHNRTLRKDNQDLEVWAQERWKSTYPSNIRQAFFTIQEEMAEILHVQVTRSGGQFYGGNNPRNKDIDERLVMQGDARDFMTLAKGTRTGFINLPSKKASKKS